MKKIKLLLVVFVLLSFTQIKLVKKKLNDKITVYLPKSFSPITKEDMKNKYETYRQPLALFSDENRMVDFGVNRSYSKWEPEDLKMMSDFYQASLMEIYDKVIFLDKGLKVVNGHEFIFFEFQSFVYPESEFQDTRKQYSYLTYGISGGTTYLFNFTCEQFLQEEWQATAQQIMSKIKLKD